MSAAIIAADLVSCANLLSYAERGMDLSENEQRRNNERDTIKRALGMIR